MQYGLLYSPINTHGFPVSAMLDTGVTQSFVNCKLAEKLPATVQMMKPLTIMLPMEKTLVSTIAINLDILIDNFIYI